MRCCTSCTAAWMTSTETCSLVTTTQVSTSRLADDRGNAQVEQNLDLSSSQDVHGCPVDGTCPLLVRKLFCTADHLCELAIQPEGQMHHHNIFLLLRFQVLCVILNSRMQSMCWAYYGFILFEVILCFVCNG